MKLFQKITGSLLAIGLFGAVLAPPVFAQSVLNDIKNRLESEGIAVIDYSSREGLWGAMTDQRWLAYLKDSTYGGGFTSLQNLIDKGGLEPLYIGSDGITVLRRLLAVTEAEKSLLTNSEEIRLKQGMIDDLRLAIAEKEDEIKEKIVKDVLGNVGKYNAEKFPEKNDPKLNTGDGIQNLIFNEVDFYFNYSKWGRLPQRIIGILEREKYESLQYLVDLEGIDNIKTALTGVVGLSSNDINLIADSVQILSASGERQINEVARAIANTMKNIVAGIALLWMTYAGARLVFAQGDETVITEQKNAILYAGVGLVSILLIGQGIDYLYGPAGVVRTTLEKDAGFTNEVLGLVGFLKAVIGTIAILFIVVSGVQTMFATGEEAETTKQKKSLLWIGVGLILIAVDKIIIENIFIIPSQEQSDQIRTSNITTIINTIGTVIQFILGFVGLIAFAALIYGAASMIINFGNDEMVENSKKIIKNAIIGIIVIISAYTIVATLVIFR